MYAHVPEVPGEVESVVDALPNDGKNSEYHACGDIVTEGWNFDGNSFTPPAPPAPEPPSSEDALRGQAVMLLAKSDIQVLRCVESGIDLPQNWVDYRIALRSIAKTGSGTIPAQPTFPTGT